MPPHPPPLWWRGLERLALIYHTAVAAATDACTDADAAAGFIVRPLGAIIFGHIGDTYGRNRTLAISIVCMAVPTVIIG